MSSFSEFRPVYGTLSRMGFYRLNPAAIRDLQAPDPGDLLKRNGSNLARLIANLGGRGKTAVEEYLAAITPASQALSPARSGPSSPSTFIRRRAARSIRGGSGPATRPTHATSARGLVALFQGMSGGGGRATVVGIDEPVIALHPAATGVLIHSLAEASQAARGIVSSHSADLLDHDDIPDTSILAALSEHGGAMSGPLDEAGRSALRDRLLHRRRTAADRSVAPRP